MFEPKMGIFDPLPNLDYNFGSWELDMRKKTLLTVGFQAAIMDADDVKSAVSGVSGP